MKSYSNYEVNISNLKCNLALFNRLVGKNTKICAIVKANAYGLGMECVCNAIDDRVDFFGVVSVEEANNLRKFNKEKPILILGVTSTDYYLWCAENNVSITISSLEQINALSQLVHIPVKVHLKVNTGLNRYGIDSLKKLKRILNIIKRSPNIVLEGIFTHFATKSEDMDFVTKQFNEFKDYLSSVDIPNCIVHCSNSFATINFREYSVDMVRLGIFMYGDLKQEKLPLKDVLEINSEIVFIHRIKKGESIGYDRTFVAPKNMVIGIVPLGYADGLDKKLSNKFHLLVEDCFCKIVGNICMDALMLDITQVKNCFVGTKVVLVGWSGKNKITIKDYADALDTSVYDVLLRFDCRRMNHIEKTRK